MSAETPRGENPAPEIIGPPNAEGPAHASDRTASSPAKGRGANGGSRRPVLMWGVGLIALVAVANYLGPSILRTFRTISTDDAYINGHVTMVAPRVQGQVTRVLVDDNMRVSKGDLLVELDREPYQVQLDIKQSAVHNAEADLNAAEAQVRATFGQVRSLRWKLQTAMEQVDNQVALLRAHVAALRSREATRDRARADLNRARALFERASISREELDQRREAERVADALAQQALEEVYETRVSLGLPPRVEKGELTDVPPDLNQNFSGVRQALAELSQSVAQVGLPLTSAKRTPKEAIDEFIRRDKEGDIDRIIERIVPDAPAVRQAKAKLMQARRDLAKAELDLRYCTVVSEIDGVVTRRNVNPGNNVLAGQALMAVRSTTEIWVDANFKETQIADLRIGQRVDCEVDMYGHRRSFEGRITGFTMGTGQTLSLLPPQNATGNFVKVVQRLPVRIELTDYDPEKSPLFVGLSVVPYVYYKEPASGPGAGEVLQPILERPKGAIAGGALSAAGPSTPAGAGTSPRPPSEPPARPL
ncbi:Multidrug export protein EmrA [Aquisphaera giovannonii]|uniref:Multidrug export protein EmrA n=1 Tax=Aquisphaera giovannonii TaxID=406548 RepID=A0A5B9WF33_9BACT|nr:HlyD family secretion protein [Aquisphaera giovannonii]QEH38869.1 Multidrug export protein EmrA [Aquisphaera giovannonii]